MEISYFLANYVILAAILNFWTLVVSNVIIPTYLKTVNGFVFYIKFGHRNKSFWKNKGDLPNPTSTLNFDSLPYLSQFLYTDVIYYRVLVTGVASHTKPGHLIELKYVLIYKIYRALDKNDSFLIV